MSFDPRSFGAGRFDRRALLKLAAAGGLAAHPAFASGAFAKSPPPASPAQPGSADAAAEAAAPAPASERYGLSFFGDLGYPADFPHFAYVDPAAPKGGMFSQQVSSFFYNQSPNTYNSFNPYSLQGNGAHGVELVYDTLMVPAADEKSGIYGCLASSVTIADDGRTYRFKLRPEARFHDGTPVTADDVAYSLDVMKRQGHGLLRMALRDAEVFEANGPGEVVITFTPTRARSVPLQVAVLPVFSKAFLAQHPFDKSSLEPPLGSGPYKVARFEPGRNVEYERVADYWGRDLPVMRGRYNFDRVRYEYFRDRIAGLEAFKAKAYLFRQEFTAREWATQYDFPAVKDGQVKVETLADESFSGVQGWFFNTRREKFFDRRVREAINLLFDFEWTRKNLMYDSYARTVSFFQNSDMMADGLPSPAELKLLDPYRAQLPAQVFEAPWVPPVSDGSGEDRALRLKAMELLKEAGYTVQNGALVSAKGEPFTIEFLDNDNSMERHHGRFIGHLKKVGIAATYRVVDPAQYEARLQVFDFDMIVRRYGFAPYPGDELRAYFSTEAARTRGSNNVAGIADPVVDALIAVALAAQTPAELTSACRALDRVLRAGFYWVPQWYSDVYRLAYWNVFARPKVKPKYELGALDTWWSTKPETAQGG